MKRRPQSYNPVAAAVLRAAILRHVMQLQLSAGLQAWLGAHMANMVNTSGRLLYITLGAAPSAGFTEGHPDIRVCLGMGSALADLTSDSRIEQHRPAIQAGLLAIDRLLPSLKAEALYDSAAQLDARIKNGEGLDTDTLKALVPKERIAA